MIFTFGRLCNFKVTVKKNHDFSPEHIYIVIQKRLEIDIKIVCGMNLCPDIVLWTFVKVQRQWKRNVAVQQKLYFLCRNINCELAVPLVS